MNHTRQTDRQRVCSPTVHPLSNPGRPDLEYGPARAEERLAAFRLLTDGNDAAAMEFERQAAKLGYPLEPLCVARRGRQVVAAMFPVHMGGVVQLGVSPSCPPDVLAGLVGATEAQFGRGVLLQTLLDPGEPTLRSAYEGAGFSRLADLLFLRRPISVAFSPALTPAGYEAVAFDEGVRGRFAEALSETYHGSLDCPKLNGCRTAEQALESHRRTGEFHADLWTLLTHEGKPAVVLLLNPETGSRNLELVYVGVTPTFRKRRLGEWAVRRALHTAYVRKFAELTLVVDGENSPALQMYFRHGFRRARQRLALAKFRGESASGGTVES